jgi:20S proteasome subunit beta 3
MSLIPPLSNSPTLPLTPLHQSPDELFETISQALLSAVDRDALSGWGAHVYIIEKDKVTKRLLKGRQD